MNKVRLPQSGMGMTDGTIVKWNFDVGDKVSKGAILCEVEAAKAMVEVEVPVDGVLSAKLVPTDENIPVGTIIAEIDEVRSSAARIQIEPAARRSAETLGVDLSKVRGSGPGGRIIESDVRAFVAAAEPPVLAGRVNAPVDGAATILPHTSTRKIIAERLAASKREVPHFYVKATCSVDALMATRVEVNRETAEVAISLNDLLIRAVALALQRTPAAHVSWDQQGMIQHSQSHVAVAVGTEWGVMAPVIRNASEKSVRAIAAEARDLATRAKLRQLAPAEIEGGTVSVSNLGMFGVHEFSAILTPPQSCVFAVGAAEEQPVVRNRVVEIENLMTVTISVDHRAVDGVTAAQLLGSFKLLVEQPVLLLT